jgi:KamA family protein
VERPKCRVFARRDIDQIPELQKLSRADRETMKAVSWVFPFRVNEYVIQELIDWSAAPDDPIYRLVFPQAGMLLPGQIARIKRLLSLSAPEEALERVAGEIQRTLNVHPAGQRAMNVPCLDGEPLPGLQHKYKETVLFFPAAGQSCHTHCTYCFRWSQFSSPDRFRFEAHEPDSLTRYLEMHPEISSVLITGGDPLVMSTEVLRQYVEPILRTPLEQVRSIRFGTKSLSYWPHRFVSDPDSDDLLRLFEEIRNSGRHVALMAHVSHPRELEPPIVQQAVGKILETGTVIRTQSPVVRGVNDEADTWADMWNAQVQLGMVPYYLFVARNTGPQHFFRVPLAEVLAIYNGAFRRVSGLARTARGPVMSATPGKVLVTGVSRVEDREVFVLEFLQGRDPSWVGRPFFAEFDPEASWLHELRPAFGDTEFFFEPGLREMKTRAGSGPRRRGSPPRWRHPRKLPVQD